MFSWLALSLILPFDPKAQLVSAACWTQAPVVVHQALFDRRHGTRFLSNGRFWHAGRPRITRSRTRLFNGRNLKENDKSQTAQPFGKKEYWREFYEQASEDFSWYATWADLEPFVLEWVDQDAKILLPGVGCDGILPAMHSAGFTKLSAFDYAPESIEYCQSMLLTKEQLSSIDLRVADARDLSAHYEKESFDCVLDKGTLDAVFLAGQTKKDRLKNLRDSVREMQRVLCPGGYFWSLSAICVDALVSSEPPMDRCWEGWDILVDGCQLHTTPDGYTSNNIDGTLMVWRKK